MELQFSKDQAGGSQPIKNQRLMNLKLSFQCMILKTKNWPLLLFLGLDWKIKMDLRNDYSGSDFGKYYLIQKIGNGSFGSVYKAFDKVLKVEKALKILEVKDPSEAYKLFSEAEIPYKCRHNNIININSGELVRFENSLVFVIDMDLISGESVEKLLKKSAISVICQL